MNGPAVKQTQQSSPRTPEGNILDAIAMGVVGAVVLTSLIPPAYYGMESFRHAWRSQNALTLPLSELSTKAADHQRDSTSITENSLQSGMYVKSRGFLSLAYSGTSYPDKPFDAFAVKNESGDEFGVTLFVPREISKGITFDDKTPINFMAEFVSPGLFTAKSISVDVLANNPVQRR